MPPAENMGVGMPVMPSDLANAKVNMADDINQQPDGADDIDDLEARLRALDGK